MAVVCGIIWARQELTKNMASVINDRGHILKDLVGIDGVDVVGPRVVILDGVISG